MSDFSSRVVPSAGTGEDEHVSTSIPRAAPRLAAQLIGHSIAGTDDGRPWTEQWRCVKHRRRIQRMQRDSQRGDNRAMPWSASHGTAETH